MPSLERGVDIEISAAKLVSYFGVCIVCTQVRGRVIEGLSQQCCSSPQGIQQALGGLLQAVGVTAELSPDANVSYFASVSPHSYHHLSSLMPSAFVIRMGKKPKSFSDMIFPTF